MYSIELLRSCDSADHVVPSSDVEGVQHLCLPGELRRVSEVVNDDQYLEEPFEVLLLSIVSNLMLRIKDATQRFCIVMAKVDRILVCVCWHSSRFLCTS